MNYLITALCFSACLPLIFIYLHQYGTLLAPAALFSSIWLITIGLFELEFVQYIRIDATTWAMLAGSGLCFLLGCLIAHIFGGGGNRVQPVSAARSEVEERRILGTLMITVPLGMVGIVMYVIVVGRLVGYDTFVRTPYLVRDLQNTDAFRAAFRWPRFLNYLNIFDLAVGAYYLVRYRGGRGTKLVALSMVLSFGSTLLGMDRTLPFAALSWAFFTAEFAHTERGARQMLTRLGILAAALVAIFVLVGQVLGKTLENNRDAAGQVAVTAEYRPLIMPYIYLTANIPAFQEFVSHTDAGDTKGIFLLLPAAKIAQVTVAPNVHIPDEVGAYYNVPFAFNTHTWLDVYWSDFGYVGLLFVPLMMGFGTTMLFLRSLRRPTFRTCIFSGLGCYVVINTVFVNKLISTPVWEFAILILVMSWNLGPAAALETAAEAEPA